MRPAPGLFPHHILGPAHTELPLQDPKTAKQRRACFPSCPGQRVSGPGQVAETQGAVQTHQL